MVIVGSVSATKLVPNPTDLPWARVERVVMEGGTALHMFGGPGVTQFDNSLHDPLLALGYRSDIFEKGDVRTVCSRDPGIAGRRQPTVFQVVDDTCVKPLGEGRQIITAELFGIVVHDNQFDIVDPLIAHRPQGRTQECRFVKEWNNNA